ncbi:MAG: hypothetical protein J0I06_27785, partial [Planctomycetes bacterium]|nr:hypothetical protein [Planctomycetota bacterium]
MGISKPLLVELWRLMEKCSANDLRRVFLVYVQVPLSNLTDPARGLEAVRTDVIEWLLLQDEGTVEAFLTGLHAVKPRAGFDAFALRLLGRPQSAAAAPPLVPPGAPVVKTVLALNMAGYGAVARQREETGGPAAVKALDERIQAFISDGLKAVGSAHDRALVRDTGDGAILVFDDPNASHHFAVAVYAALTAPGNDG